MKGSRSVFIKIAVLVAMVGLNSTNHVSGSWSKNNVSMSGTHSATWIQPLSRKLQSSSSAHPPFGTIQYIFADARLEDRCRNGNGVWLAWQTFGYQVKSANNSIVSGNAVAQGQYQDCLNGHQYRNTSRHIFNDTVFGLSETHTLTSQ